LKLLIYLLLFFKHRNRVININFFLYLPASGGQAYLGQASLELQDAAKRFSFHKKAFRFQKAIQIKL